MEAQENVPFDCGNAIARPRIRTEPEPEHVAMFAKNSWRESNWNRNGKKSYRLYTSLIGKAHHLQENFFIASAPFHNGCIPHTPRAVILSAAKDLLLLVVRWGYNKNQTGLAPDPQIASGHFFRLGEAANAEQGRSDIAQRTAFAQDKVAVGQRQDERYGVGGVVGVGAAG